MARLQILELPEVFVGEASETPFVLVVDQADEVILQQLAFGTTVEFGDGNGTTTTPTHEYLKQQLGARAILVFTDTIEIPANDTTAYLGAAHGGLPADAHYETIIDGKPVEWTRADELHARAVDAVQERTDIARDMDRLANHKHKLLDALGMDRTRDWDDIRNAAAGLRKERDAQVKTIQYVRDFPAVPEAADYADGPSREYLAGYQAAVEAIRRGTFFSTIPDA